LEGISVPKKINEEKHQFRGNAFLTAEQPWSGHYKVPPALWINAHWGQFVQPGWRYLDNGLGSGFLPKGGSFVTLVPPKHDNVVHGQTVQFSVIVETLQGTCGKHPRDCDVPHFSDWQVLTFNLSSSHFAFSTEQMPIRLDLWCSNSTNAFVKHSDIVVEDSTGSFTVTMPPDTLCTISTVQHAKKGKHQDPPPPAPFPTTYQSDFSAIEGDHLSWLFSDVYGSFAVRDGSLTQVATALPIGWAPVNIDPLTLFGDRHWNRVHLQVVAKVNHTAFHHYIRICGGCGNVSYRRILFECPESLCFKLFGDGKWMFGNISGTLDVFRDTWHEMEVGIEDRVMSVNFDHRLLLSSPAIDTTGMVGIGCGSYHMCAIRSFSVSADSVSSTL
jgi:galactosylceramidase